MSSSTVFTSLTAPFATGFSNLVSLVKLMAFEGSITWSGFLRAIIMPRILGILKSLSSTRPFCPPITKGSEVEIFSFTDILPSPFLYPVINIYTDAIGQEIFLDAINSNAIDSNYILSWTTDDGNIVAHPDSLYPLISSSGTYVLEITHPETGCVITNEAFVNIIDPVSVFSPTKNTLTVEITPTITNDEIRVHYVMEKTNSVSMQIYNVGGVLFLIFAFILI